MERFFYNDEIARFLEEMQRDGSRNVIACRGDDQRSEKAALNTFPGRQGLD